MIATILPSSANFHAVEYNERKVAQGKAELLEMSNFGYLSNTGEYTWEDLPQYLLDYSSKNDHIKYPQFHLAISCKGDEYSHEQLVEFAHRYLEEMGYGQPGQPLLIYAHHDTDNTHIHVITSRIDPDGKKIDHKFEKVRSQLVVDQLMGVDEEQRVSDTVAQALEYHFSTPQQFMAILQSFGYETTMDEDEIILKRNGSVQEKVKLQLVESKCSQEKTTWKRLVQLRAILKKYRDMSSDRQQLADVMKERFGVSLVFFGSKDKPYGYTIVDHHTKTVFKGSDVVKIKELLKFMTKKERFERLASSILQMMEDVDGLTTKDLNRMLRRQFGTRLMNGSVHFNGTSVRLPEDILKTLRSNDRRAWIQSFLPTSLSEAAVLCAVCKFDHPEQIKVSAAPGEMVGQTAALLRHIFNTTADEKLRDVIHESGIRLKYVEGQFFAIDFVNRTILNLNAYGFDVKRLLPKRQHPQQVRQPSGHTKAPNLLRQRGGSSDTNREWEVGHNSYEVDDERILKR